MNKKKWKKTEEKLNRWLEKVIQSTKSTASKKTPKKLKALADKTKDQKAKTKEKTLHLLHKVFLPIISFFKNFHDHANKFLNKIQSLLVQFTMKVQSLDFSNVNLASITIGLGTLLLSVGKKLQIWFGSMKATTIAKLVSISAVSSLTALSLISTGKKIQDEQSKRQPASIEKVERVNKGRSLGTRPEYFKKEKRFLKVYNVRLPITVDLSPNPKTKSVKVNFTLVTSNRYTRAYLNDNAHRLHDRLNTMVQPIVPTFPLKEEGKQVLKEKITRELNALIKELGIDGRIKEIYLESILEV